MKLYISGPMTGEIGLNVDAFAAAAATLRAAGYEVVSPTEIDHPGETSPGSLSWAAYMRRDLQAMLDCPAIALLPGAERSRGSMLELSVASRLDFDVFTYDAERLIYRCRTDDPPL